MNNYNYLLISRLRNGNAEVLDSHHTHSAFNATFVCMCVCVCACERDMKEGQDFRACVCVFQLHSKHGKMSYCLSHFSICLYTGLPCGCVYLSLFCLPSSTTAVYLNKCACKVSAAVFIYLTSHLTLI